VRRRRRRLSVGRRPGRLIRLRGLRLLGLVRLVVADRAPYRRTRKTMMPGYVPRNTAYGSAGSATRPRRERRGKQSDTQQAGRGKMRSLVHDRDPSRTAGGQRPDTPA
jgi:hypothetical protein